MKSVLIGILAAILCYIFGTKPLVIAFGGRMTLGTVLLVDLAIGLIVGLIVAL